MNMLVSLVFIVAGLARLGAALPGVPLQGRQTTQAPASTITGYAHPLSLSPLKTRDATVTPLSYPSPPTPISVPTSRGDPLEAATAQAKDAIVITSLSSAKGCTTIAGNYPTQTVPAFCNPSALVNAPTLETRSGLAVATVTISGVTNKLDCCAGCAGIYNCFAWQFKPAWSGPPSERLPGGFDPWGRGDCEAVYYTGPIDEDNGVGTDGAASVCPNGRLSNMLIGTNNTATGPNGERARWSNLYFNGWNQGSCGDAEAIFEASTDPGIGDADTLCGSSAASS
ncbi:hypothetical protein F4775DRAFT_489098 [Biscogniauxia sp. FL1348]|nr:hypothetical protein F4775DRAFT_489098 [Biscogniauxia sp. FL1348]